MGSARVSSARKLTPPPSSSTPRSHNAQRSRHLGSPHESHGDIVRAAGAPSTAGPLAFGDRSRRSLLDGNEKSSERVPRWINRQQPPDVHGRSISLGQKRITPTRSAAKSIRGYAYCDYRCFFMSVKHIDSRRWIFIIIIILFVY